MTYTSVAVVIDEQGTLTRFSGNTRVRVYRKDTASGNTNWECTETIPFCTGAADNLAQMRDSLRRFVAALGDTRVLVATSISGIAYSVLDQRGFRLCEMDSFFPDCLDALAESVNAPADTRTTADCPVETSVPGHYVCDLTAILQEYPDLTSKKVLRPFFDKTPFVSLQILFGHVPPWLLPELAERGLGCAVSDADGGKVRLDVFSPAHPPQGAS